MTKNQMAMHQIGRGHAPTDRPKPAVLRRLANNQEYRDHLADLANRRIARREKLLAARMEQERKERQVAAREQQRLGPQ